MVRETLAETTDHLVLACTYYIALEKVIQSEFPEAIIHDPIPDIASSLHRDWPPMTSGDTVLTSGSYPEMRQGAKSAFMVDLPESKL